MGETATFAMGETATFAMGETATFAHLVGVAVVRKVRRVSAAEEYLSEIHDFKYKIHHL